MCKRTSHVPNIRVVRLRAGKNDTNKQNEGEEEIEDWDGNLKKQKELKEQELENSNTKNPQ